MIMPFTRPDGTTLGLSVLGSGSAGNAMVIHGADGGLLIDAGFSATELRRRLEQAGIPEGWVRAILITHEHHDHVQGLRLCARAWSVPVYCTRLTGDQIRERGHAESDQALHLFTPGAPFEFQGFRVEPFTIPHDAADPVGFTVHWGDRKIAVVTDLGHANGLVHLHLNACDGLVVESNHDVGMLMNSRRPMHLKHRIRGRHGHLSNLECMELLRHVLHARTRYVVLVHASRECNRYELVERCIAECLTGLGRADVATHVARQDVILPTLWV